MLDLSPGRGAGDLRRRHARPDQAVLSALPRGVVGVQGRLRHRGRHSRGPTPIAGAPAPSIWAAPSPRSPTPNVNARKARWRNGHSCCSGSSTWPTRPASAGNLNPIYAYAHVPFGYTGDATAAVVDQIERFAPGFRDRIIATVSMSHRRIAGRTTRTTSAATSSAAPTTGCRCCCGRGWRSTRMRSVCRGSTCVRSRLRLAPESTGCAATTPPHRRCAGCEAVADARTPPKRDKALIELATRAYGFRLRGRPSITIATSMVGVRPTDTPPSVPLNTFTVTIDGVESGRCLVGRPR